MNFRNKLNVVIIIVGIILAGFLMYRSLQEEDTQEVIGVDRNEER